MNRSFIILVLAAVLALGMVGAIFMIRTNFPEVFQPAAVRYDDEAFMCSVVETRATVGSVSRVRDGLLTTSAKKCSGVNTVWYADGTAAENVVVQCSLTVESGRAKVVCVRQTGEVTVLAEASGETVNYTGTLPITSGKDRIRLVTDEAAYTLEMEADTGKLIMP